ncbi:MAG: kinetochore-associated Ndc80 complex subunit nuf2 [Phylliscum demangeonii]|nr:MAG: kinetochore-associated Ndc80 complex subunit nuf2 [Phylliscum demangeonii]
MAFNGRTSQAYGNIGPNVRLKRKEDDSNAFMRLPDKEIAGCISDIGIPFGVADLQKPNPQQIQLVFEWLAELLINATRETVEPAMRAAVEDVVGEHGEIVSAETRNLLAFFVRLRRLLHECGISDFHFQDVLKPTHERLVRIFSYVINFVRFRESQTAVIDAHFNRAEMTKVRIEALYAENQALDGRVAAGQASRAARAAAVADKIRRNDGLKTRLLELRQAQDTITARLERAKADKAARTARLEDATAAVLTARQASAKLRPYVQQQPAAGRLQAALAALAARLQAERAAVDAVERRSRALHTSAESLAVVAAEVAACVKLLDDVAAERRREEDERARAARHRDALAERGNQAREVERAQQMLARQCAKWIERTEQLRHASQDRAARASQRMDALRRTHRQLHDARADKARDIETRRVRIEQTEKKMADLSDTIQREIQLAHDQFLTLDAHIQLYITEMEQCLA